MKDFDPYYLRSSHPKRELRDPKAESLRIAALLDAFAGGHVSLLQSYIERIGLNWLAKKLATGDTFSDVETSTLRLALGFAPDYLVGKADMFGQPLLSGRPPIPPFFLTGDVEAGTRLATLLGQQNMDGATHLQQLAEPGILRDRAHADEVLKGTAPLGYVPLVHILALAQRKGVRLRPLTELLGVTTTVLPVLPRLPQPIDFRPAVTPVAPPPPRLRTRTAKTAVAVPELSPAIPILPEEPEMDPLEEIGVLEPPRFGSPMEALFGILSTRPEREAFGDFLKGEFTQRKMRWYSVAQTLGYRSRGQFYHLLHGKGLWRPQAFFLLPHVLGMTDEQFVDASGLLAPPPDTEKAP